MVKITITIETPLDGIVTGKVEEVGNTLLKKVTEIPEKLPKPQPKQD